MRAGYRRLAVFAALLAGCSSGAPVTAPSPSPSAGTTVSVAPTPTADPAKVHADELGRVPVLMYHQVVAQPKGDYDITPAAFRAELTLLYRSGYRTITAADLVAGRVDVPAGLSPMVLTFDDSTVSQYASTGGTVDPASAAGVLLEVGRRYEQHPVATFYVNARPFAGKDAYLKELVDLGMEVGDHTATHANLRQLDAAGVQAELRDGLAVIRRAVPGYDVTTMALPFGAHPHDEALAHKGSGYSFAGVFLVGAGPARSPYSKDFDPFDVPRIRSGPGDFESGYWLPKLRATRFVSDGDPATISFPRPRLADLSPGLRGRARPY